MRGAIVVVLMVVGLLAMAFVPADSAIIFGAAVALGSLAVGAIAGLVYHVVLHRSLARAGVDRRASGTLIEPPGGGLAIAANVWRGAVQTAHELSCPEVVTTRVPQRGRSGGVVKRASC